MTIPAARRVVTLRRPTQRAEPAFAVDAFI
jgi:hypothetical protein